MRVFEIVEIKRASQFIHFFQGIIFFLRAKRVILCDRLVFFRLPGMFENKAVSGFILIIFGIYHNFSIFTEEFRG